MWCILYLGEPKCVWLNQLMFQCKKSNYPYIEIMAKNNKNIIYLFIIIYDLIVIILIYYNIIVILLYLIKLTNFYNNILINWVLFHYI